MLHHAFTHHRRGQRLACGLYPRPAACARECARRDPLGGLTTDPATPDSASIPRWRDAPGREPLHARPVAGDDLNDDRRGPAARPTARVHGRVGRLSERTNMDKHTNTVMLSGMLASVSQRAIGAQGRTLYELRLDVSKPAARGREAETMVVPIIVWTPEVGLAAGTLDVGTPITVIGRVSARSWTPAAGGAEKLSRCSSTRRSPHLRRTRWRPPRGPSRSRLRSRREPRGRRAASRASRSKRAYPPALYRANAIRSAVPITTPVNTRIATVTWCKASRRACSLAARRDSSRCVFVFSSSSVLSGSYGLSASTRMCPALSTRLGSLVPGQTLETSYRRSPCSDAGRSRTRRYISCQQKALETPPLGGVTGSLRPPARAPRAGSSAQAPWRS